MKYIKHFEDEEYYEIGDYYLILDEHEHHKAKLILILTLFKHPLSDKYIFKVLNDKSNDFYETRVSYMEIERKLTPAEIEDFEIKIEATKYNL